MHTDAPPAVYLGPAQPAPLVAAIERARARIADSLQADAIVWTGTPSQFPDTMPESVRWIQLPSAGVESWFATGKLTSEPGRTWTSAAGAYSASVAEHALALLLAGVRDFRAQFAATSWDQAGFGAQTGSLRGALVAIVGCGGIGRALIPLLNALGADVLAVNRSGKEVPGAHHTLPADRLAEVWPQADHVVLAAPSTGATSRMVGSAELAAMRPDAWLVNIARGSLIDTDALVDALRANMIGGAALDVTDPEPLPDGHPLWTLPNAMITPHVANPPSALAPAYADHVGSNVARFVSGQPLDAVIDVAAGY
jgi:phosphoglycerate dehydrogenase-like enzyme